MMKQNGQVNNTSVIESGFRQFIGMTVRELTANQAVMELTIGPQHRNSHGSLHGGVLTSIIDNSGGLAGCYCPASGNVRKAVTLSLTTSFIASVSSGVIQAIGHKRSGGRRIFVSTIEVTDEAGNLIALGEATYRYVDKKLVPCNP